MSRAVLVTARWGDSHGESGAAIRMIAGALLPHGHVEVVSLDACGSARTMSDGASGSARTMSDGALAVHELAATAADPVRAALVRAALARNDTGRLPPISGRRVLELAGGRSPGAAELIASLEPDAVVLAGAETWWLPDLLKQLEGRARIVSVPFVGLDPIGDLPQLRPLLTMVDAVGVFSRKEAEHLSSRPTAQSRPEQRGVVDLVELEVAFPVYSSAAESEVPEISASGPYVVVMTGYPPGSAAAVGAPGDDYVRHLLGPVGIVEIGVSGWSFSTAANGLRELAGATRANLRRLLRHATVMLDLRPQGAVGRETLESLLLGTPVVVPEGTVAAEHAERSNGGLWYRDYRELFGAAKKIVDDEALRSRLGRQGREWAERRGGIHFSRQVASLILG